jgi:hypothetical protein
MQHHLSTNRRRAVCSVLGFPPKNTSDDASSDSTVSDNRSISDVALVLYLALILTAKPKAVRCQSSLPARHVASTAASTGRRTLHRAATVPASRDLRASAELRSRRPVWTTSERVV